MGGLKDLVAARSKFIRIEFGETTPPLIYKGFKEIQNSFGAESIRYTFEMETTGGLISKTFDSGNSDLAIQMDAIPFGEQVTITKDYALDDEGNQVKTQNGQYFVGKFTVTKV